jgi:protein phosphatase
MTRELAIPELSLVVLVGVSSSGKSTFASQHFKPTEIISSDFCRGLVADDEDDQSATADAFDVLHYIAGKRLEAGRLTVVDATNVQAHARKPLVELARSHDVLPVAIVLDVPESTCLARNSRRANRDIPTHAIHRQHADLRRSLSALQKEGFRTVHVLRGEAEIASAGITRTKMFSDLRHEAGPFDVIGDVHGCRAELELLLEELGYAITRDEAARPVNAIHPRGRRVIFLGDLVDRGPDTPGVLRLAMGMVAAGTALCVAGNHEAKLLRAMRGKKVTVSHGLEESLKQLDREDGPFCREVETFLDGLTSHFVLDGGRLVVAHAGLAERMQGRASGRVRSFCLYGQTTGETDEYGLPVRYPWAEDYRGRAMVLYGHTPVPAAEWVNNTMCLDTGCVFGGHLTALNYPERTLHSVPASRVYYQPSKPLAPAPESGAPDSGPAVPGAAVSGARREPGVLDVRDVSGSRVIETGYLPRVSIREENAAAALEVMSRFAVDPRWLLYLPPTMSPVTTASGGAMLELPEQAFDAYRDMGVDEVVCEEKHMGSRAVLLVCRSADAAAVRFGIGRFGAGRFGAGRFGVGDGVGAVWTRTGRPFFAADLAALLLDRARAAAEAAGLFDELDTSWLLLDAEIMPWSAKAGQLLRDQYAAVGASAHAALPAAVRSLSSAASRGVDVAALLERTSARLRNADGFTAAYKRYCWPVTGLDGVRVAPFQVLASQGMSHAARPHGWHLAAAARLAAADPSLFAETRHVHASTSDPSSRDSATSWWTSLTASGGEGMVVKPAAGLVHGARGIVQPGLKVRGPEYLRIIYGPDYTEDGNLSRLRMRAVGRKRSLALREYALGLEALDRVAQGEPLWRVHECVFGVLALESEPVDPRLLSLRGAKPLGDGWCPPGGQPVEEDNRVLVDEDHIAVLGAQEARVGHRVQLAAQRREEPGHVEHAAGLDVDAELGPRDDLEELVEGAKAAGQHDEGVRPVGHGGLALVHGLRDGQAGQPVVRELLGLQLTGDDPVHLATGGQRGVRDDPHQPDVPAAVDDLRAALGEQRAQPSGRPRVREVNARAGAAVDRDGLQRLRHAASRSFASA